MSRTSKGEVISVSFELVEPPETSFLIADLPPASRTPSILAAHRNVVLLAITSCYETGPPVVDIFVYQAGRLPSLLLLPSAGAPVFYSHRMAMGVESLGIMSCTSTDDDGDSSPPFLVAYIQLQMGRTVTIDAHLFRSGSGKWEVIKNLLVNGANNDGFEHPLHYWSTDVVLRYGRRCMIWVDYYRGMLMMDLSLLLQSLETAATKRPRLRYVPLPVDKVGNPEGFEFDDNRGCPKASRSVCITRYGIKFVSVDRQHWSNFGIGHRHTLTWSHRFRITTWSLCEDDYTWRNDVTMHEDFFWDTFDGGERFPFPHVQPQFPVVDVDNPDIAVFHLDELVATQPKWMIEVDLRKKVLLAATNCSKLSGFDPIRSELPLYLDGGQACKKRRQ